jgi:hypothetical protein
MVSVMDPQAFLNVSRQNLQANVWKYPRPAGSWAVMDIRMKDSSTGGYVSLGMPLDSRQLDTIEQTAGGVTRFGFFGRFIRLAPTPDLDVTDGLEWWFVEGVTVETGETHDSESFPFHTGLANLHVLLTQEILEPEQTGDNIDALRKLISAEQELVPLYYRRTLGEEIGFSIPDVSKPGDGSGRGPGVPFGTSWS